MTTTTDISPYEPVPHDAPAPEPARPQLLLIGTCLACAAVLVGYYGLLGHYVSVRADVLQAGEVWIPQGVIIPLTQPNFMMLTMLMSILSMLWAIASVRNDDRANAYIAFVLTLVFGFAQIAQTFYLLSILDMHITGDDRAALIYALIGIQVFLTGTAMLYVAAMAIRTMGGGYSAKDYEGVLAAGIYWFTIVWVYLSLWYAIYITK